MCNFVIRPIKSYATVQLGSENEEDYVIKRGDVVDVKIIDIDTESKRISISIRALLEDQADDDAAEDDAE